jgi:hypothetical protein
MFEDDMILPDDFEMPTEAEPVEDTIPAESTEEQIETTEPELEQPTEQTPFLKVKYNKEEMELDEERARELAQMGMNYPKLQEKLQALESDPRLSFVEELAQQFNMSVPEYLDAVKAQKEEQRIQELVEQGISQELAQEMLENRKFREQFEAEKRAKADEAKKNEEYNEFFEYFRQANGRDYQPNQDNIPESVWEAANNGIPLKFAYLQHENQQIKQQLQTFKQNQSNAQKAPVGSVTAHGSTEEAAEDLFMQGFNSIK